MENKIKNIFFVAIFLSFFIIFLFISPILIIGKDIKKKYESSNKIITRNKEEKNKKK